MTARTCRQGSPCPGGRGSTMSRVLDAYGPSSPAGIVAVALALVTAVGITACGGGAGDDGRHTASSPTNSAARETPEPILIKTRVKVPNGRIVDGSTVGDIAFCPGGTVIDKHGTPDIGLVERTVTCQDGTLRIGFDPQQPVGNTQSGPWRIIS